MKSLKNFCQSMIKLNNCDKPKIIYFLNAMERGGAEHGLITLIENDFFPPTHELHIVTIALGEHELAAKLKHPAVSSTTHFSDAPRVTFFAFLSALVKFPCTLARLRPQTVVLSLSQANIIGRFYLMFVPGIRVISFEHLAEPEAQKWRYWFYDRLERILSPRVNTVWADAPTTLAMTRKKYRNDMLSRTFEVVPLVAVAHDAPLATLPPQPPFILIAAARLIHRKRLHLVIETVAKLRENGHDIQLHIYGHGPERAKLEASAKTCQISPYVIFHGYKNQWSMNLTGHAFVNYSENEGLCIANIEAMAAGLPIITTNVGAISDYANNETARIVTDPDDLARAIVELMSDLARARTLAAAGREYVLQHYASDLFAPLGLTLLSERDG